MERIEKFLKEREKENLLRTLKPASKRSGGKIFFKEKEFFDFSSNDYLGLSDHPRLKKAASEALDRWGTSASASRLLSGDLDIHHELESRVAGFKGKESALIFNSGYQANVSIISSICGRDDVVFSDRLNHASIVDGILLSGAKFFRFRHNDANHLRDLLKKERNKFKEALIVTETIFSMDGDRPPLGEIALLAERYGSTLMADEAHATGIFGEKGSGVIEEENLTERVDLIMGTFGKALGGFGAYVASSSSFKNFFINSSRGFIYSTALPPAVIATDLEGIALVEDEPLRRKELVENAGYFRDGLNKAGFDIRGSSQIVPLILGDNKKTVRMSEALKEALFWALPIRPPTVPEGESRLRFSLTYHHSKDTLARLIDVIKKIS